MGLFSGPSYSTGHRRLGARSRGEGREGNRIHGAPLCARHSARCVPCLSPLTLRASPSGRNRDSRSVGVETEAHECAARSHSDMALSESPSPCSVTRHQPASLVTGDGAGKNRYLPPVRLRACPHLHPVLHPAMPPRAVPWWTRSALRDGGDVCAGQGLRPPVWP